MDLYISVPYSNYVPILHRFWQMLVENRRF